jgi:hypothetical protein
MSIIADNIVGSATDSKWNNIAPMPQNEDPGNEGMEDIIVENNRSIVSSALAVPIAAVGRRITTRGNTDQSGNAVTGSGAIPWHSTDGGAGVYNGPYYVGDSQINPSAP